MAQRWSFTDQFRAKVGSEARRVDQSVPETSSEHQLDPNPVRRRKRQAIGGMADAILGGPDKAIGHMKRKPDTH